MDRMTRRGDMGHSKFDPIFQGREVVGGRRPAVADRTTGKSDIGFL